MKTDSKRWKTVLSDGAGELGLDLSSEQIHQFSIYSHELILWNKKINITAITDPLDIAIKHFLDSIACILEINNNSTLIDIGSGGGFPGIPLKIVMPSLNVTLIDASRKRVNFLKHIIRTLKLTQIEAIHIRAEDMAMDDAYKNSFGVAVSRAFSSLEHFFKLASPLVKPEGKIIAMKAKKACDEVASYNSDNCPVKKDYQLPFLEADRSMVIFSNHS